MMPGVLGPERGSPQRSVRVVGGGADAAAGHMWWRAR